MNELRKLAIANAARQTEWDPEGKTSSFTYRAAELAGEAGEAANILKKLERERLGIRGSRATKQQLADELADVVICASLAANVSGIDLWDAVVSKFNKTSADQSLSVTLPKEG
jgi:NTP pyrophosphatase (non-canonical NTP hydrolase)